MTQPRITMLALAAGMAFAGTMAALAQTTTTPPAPAATPVMPAPDAGAAADQMGHKGKHGGPDGKHGKKGKKGKHHGMMMPGIMERFDTDKDGTVTPAETEAGVATLLSQFDADKDGALQRPEYEALQAELLRPMTERAFQRMDSNGDGKIDQSEAATAAARMSDRGPKGPRPAERGETPPPSAPVPAPAN